MAHRNDDATDLGHVLNVQLPQFRNSHFQKATSDFQYGIIGQAGEYLTDALKSVSEGVVKGNISSAEFIKYRMSIIKVVNQINKAIGSTPYQLSIS